MKENTSATVPGTTVKIAIMKTIEGEWQVTRTAQLGIVAQARVTFRAQHEKEARVFADLLWANTVAARDAQIDAADKVAYATFAQAQKDKAYIVEMRLD